MYLRVGGFMTDDQSLCCKLSNRFFDEGRLTVDALLQYPPLDYPVGGVLRVGMLSQVSQYLVSHFRLLSSHDRSSSLAGLIKRTLLIKQLPRQRPGALFDVWRAVGRQALFVRAAIDAGAQGFAKEEDSGRTVLSWREL